MSIPRIFADFNGLTDNEVGLEYFGSLRDLSRLRLRLSEGMKLVVYDPSDGDEVMEMEGMAAYRHGRWGAVLDASSFRRVPNQSVSEPPFDFPCFHCGKDIYGWLCESKLQEDTACPECRGLVKEALRKPVSTQ
jgi:hypothetical protein